MSRMPMLTPQTASDQAVPTLENIRRQLGMLPNFFAGLAHHGGALNGYLQFERQLAADSRLSKAQHELIALAVANANGCHYCVSGHTLSARHAGINAEAAHQAQIGRAEGKEEQAILTFALAMLEAKGHVSDAVLDEARLAGLSDGMLVEITAWVGVNSFSNWINNLIRPVIDFPEVALV
ncbi:MAG: carboxymuconolactone decarboxylase family protein [Oceanisphaera sp.]|nr:carboxymuconolactone decarboxylase family protein [Oceanisphaera sp.]